MKEIKLSEYNIVYHNANQSLKRYLQDKEYASIAILVDENTKEHCLPSLPVMDTVHHKVILIDSGESNKILPTCEHIWSKMSLYGMDRHSLLINLGGGVIGDMGGFAASCYMRGIDFIQIPTTLLSQVDASIGGKLAIDFNGLKNFIGMFKNPNQVIVDHAFLATLPTSELRSGYAEMLKHALIKDKTIWKRLNAQKWQEVAWTEEIFDSILIKKHVVEEDPLEKGLRKILNFGHSIGHAIETVSFSTENPLLHGEAIGLGMICESYIATQKLGLDQESLEEITSVFLGIYNNLDLSILSRTEEIISIIGSDKKNKGGKLQFSLLKAIGEAVFDVEVAPVDIHDSLQYLIRQTK